MDLQKIMVIVSNATNFSGVIQIHEKGEVRLNIAKGYAKGRSWKTI